jgi:RHS repeat-associated protein
VKKNQPNQTATSAPATITVNALPTVSLTSPANGATFTAPAAITLTATASDADGTISKVEFFHGGANLIATVTTPPYTYNWTNVAAGGYSLTAKATDNLNGASTSSPVNVTVNAGVALYFIHTDHLNTPRLIASETGQTAWQWENTDPFGANAPNENPSGLGTFTCNLRLPGQYFDKETNLHYNYFRDYDPSIGRYIQSDPIGLRGGINTYAYANSNPLSFTDPDGRDPSGNKPSVPPPQQSAGGSSMVDAIRQRIQGNANADICQQNAMAAGALVGACVVGAATKTWSGALGGLILGGIGGALILGDLICLPYPQPSTKK